MELTKFGVFAKNIANIANITLILSGLVGCAVSSWLHLTITCVLGKYVRDWG